MATNSVETIYTANLGFATISTANPNLDGTGALSSVITGTTNGTLIKTLIIKAQTNTSQGMIRFYTQKSGGSNLLLSEVYVAPVIKSGRDVSYYNNIPLNYTLESGEQLLVSTENSDTFNIIAEAFDISYNATPAYMGSSLEYIAKAGSGIINTPNSNLDGTGALTQIFVAGSTTYKGCAISSIVIKAQQTTLPGMVRLYVQDNVGGGKILFCEVVIPSIVQSATTQAFSCQVILQGSLCLPPDFSVWASTQESNTFSVIIEGSNWKNV